MKILAVVQARMGSVRLPGKVLKKVNGIPLIEVLLLRLSKSKLINQIVIATSIEENNLPLVNHIREIGFEYYQGSEKNVLQRYVDTAKEFSADIVIRITGDCPLIDPVLVDQCINSFLESKMDYLSNSFPATFPDGLDVEIINFKALEKANEMTRSDFDREHVTPFIKNSGFFTIKNISYEKDLSHLRWTIDNPEDYRVISNVFEYFSPNIYFTWKDVLKMTKDKPNLFLDNSEIQRNEGLDLGQGQKLWQRAKNIIPGGNMLLSKRSEMFLPKLWPSYFSKAKGCSVWDLDGKEFIDMSIMGIGTNILGYGNEEVDDAVKNSLEKGNMSTFNCPEEVYLAEKLIAMHPWSEMVRLARTGGEANSIAIRIARAASGNDKVAICGYHGWHDWYLAANLSAEDNLDTHLLPGLEAKGVPKNLKNTIFPFQYNRIDELEKLIKNQNIGAIKMEVQRNIPPNQDFLEKVRYLATKNNIILIFDECTSGFRESFGGLHLKYNIEPDLAIFGKALGNGYAITAILGKRDIMESAQSTFISSTFWTERLGPTAALKTLEVMQRESSWEQITNTGKLIQKFWKDMSKKYNLDMTFIGIPALTAFTINSKYSIEYKTLITQEMLGKGYLAANSVYVCTKHTSDILSGYFEAIDPIFNLIADCENGRDVYSLLKGPVCHSGFQRLN